MKVANIIIAHKNPGQLLRLIDQYDPSRFHHYVHIDRRNRLEHWKNVVQHPNVTLLKKRRKLVYAGYGFVGATLDAFHLIARSSEHFFYVNVMSGLDFPIRPTRAFYDFLKDTYERAPREFFEIRELSEWPGAHRYQRFHLIDWTIRGRYFAERIINTFVAPRTFYGGKFVPYGRAAWFTASDHFVNYALKYLEENPGYLRFLKTCWSPDEFIFNTLVMNSPFRDKVAPYLRHIDWSEGKVTPKVFRSADLEALLASGCFLARKFDETVDRGIIDSLEKIIKANSGNKPG